MLKQMQFFIAAAAAVVVSPVMGMKLRVKEDAKAVGAPSVAATGTSEWKDGEFTLDGKKFDEMKNDDDKKIWLASMFGSAGAEAAKNESDPTKVPAETWKLIEPYEEDLKKYDVATDAQMKAFKDAGAAAGGGCVWYNPCSWF